MIRLVSILLLASCVPAHAGPPEGIGAPAMYASPPPLMFVPASPEHEAQGALGVIRFRNHVSFGGVPDVVTLTTPLGDFLFEVTNTRNDQCVPACPDSATFIEGPEGLNVIPHEIVVDENAVGEILIVEYLGG